jgi:hypothetical protein
LSDFIEKRGPMVEPLRDADYLARAFGEMGAPTWPNGHPHVLSASAAWAP